MKLPSFADLATSLKAEFGADSCALHLLRISLQHDGYDRDTAFTLLSAGRGRSGESWRERRLAILLLENELLRLSSDKLTEFDLILTDLGLKPEIGLAVPVNSCVLEEGYSALDLRGFVRQLIQRLRRLNRVHQFVGQGQYDRIAWEYFFRTARDVCKLTLARYAFTAEEVFREILCDLRVTEGAEDTISRSGKQPATYWAGQPLDIPEFEKAILRKLCASRRIYWVSERCGSGLNSLVEYPLTSAVVVIKPPGSDFEIEIKRAGTRHTRLLDVIRTRNGKEAPTSHRLLGGSLGWLSQRETVAAGIFSKIYRLVHGVQGPCSRGVMNSSIVTVPGPEGEHHILDYLTEEGLFGAGFEEMRAAMKVCVETFPSDTGVARASWRGEAGLTLEFTGQALPQQAILLGSSSFRLDRIDLYLSDTGPEQYFRVGLGRGYTVPDARWLADTVLEEILGEVAAPPEGYLDYSQYVRDAFRVDVNRRRADENYVSVMRQIGECWGTLLAVRGFSDGESFVQRNVGLKSVWRNGAWNIRIIFMDNDDLTVAGSRYQHLWPWREASGMERDEIHILGGPMGDEMLPGEAGALRSIYRVSAEVGDMGSKALERELRRAYLRTQSQLDCNPELRSIFHPRFLEGREDFDELVPWFLKTEPSETESWKAAAGAHLKAKGYEDELAEEYTKTVCHFRRFFERLHFLYIR